MKYLSTYAEQRANYINEFKGDELKENLDYLTREIRFCCKELKCKEEDLIILMIDEFIWDYKDDSMVESITGVNNYTQKYTDYCTYQGVGNIGKNGPRVCIISDCGYTCYVFKATDYYNYCKNLSPLPSYNIMEFNRLIKDMTE